ncbi:MAG: stress response translation initiation inhibitor YciH [Planctomycetes bacterium]|nr:stress response translation initiation inhibitor YciH [Planctomycetota bacterium]
MPRDRSIVWDDAFGGRPPAEPAPPAQPAGDGIVRIRRETSGRGGKTVTTVAGVPLVGEELKQLAKELKRRCGVGGALKDDVIEIQGDHRDAVEQELRRRGFTVKRAGG